jgi:hypothetical protein
MWLFACGLAWVIACSPSSGKQLGGTGGAAGRSATGGNGGAGGTAPGGGGVASGGTNSGFTLTLPGLGGGGGTTTTAPDDCADSAKVVYLVTQENYLYSFDPRLDGLSAYKRIGTLTCETASTPQSMSVDRLGKAYVFYSSGHLYYVSTTTAECTPTGYQHPVTPTKSFNQLGMGFTAEALASNKQVLFIHSPDFGLATIDLLSLSVGKIGVLQTSVAELTGGPDALLFMYASNNSELSQIDRGTYQTTLIHKFGMTGVSAFAFARYAGVFYIFTASGSRTVTTMFDVQNNTESVRDPDIGVTVVGAGQSTCVPPPPIP